MKKIFLFGKFYDKDEIKDITSIMKSKTSYEINKNTFLTEIYNKEGTIEKSYNYLKKNIIDVEKIKEKDLMYFNVQELIDLMYSLTTNNISTKDRIYNLINSYLNWAVSKKYIYINNLNGLDKEELCKVNKKLVVYKYTPIVNLDKKCIEAVKSGEVSVIDIVPLIIIRYGIEGKGMSKLLNLSWNDINFEDNVVKILEGDCVKMLPIDDIFLKWIKMAKECTSFQGIEYIDEGKVVKRWDKYYEISNGLINNRLTRAFQRTDLQRINLKSLEFSRKVDLLLVIREERVLKSMDFRRLIANFDSYASPASTNILIKEYESLTEDKVQPMRSKGKVKYTDNNPKETVINIKKRLGII